MVINMRCAARQIIEKRRRDRINNSLSELRRLVPSAFEKQVRGGGKNPRTKSPINQIQCEYLRLILTHFVFPSLSVHSEGLSQAGESRDSANDRGPSEDASRCWRQRYEPDTQKYYLLVDLSFWTLSLGAWQVRKKKNFGSRQTKYNKHSIKVFHVTPTAFKTQEKHLIRIMKPTNKVQIIPLFHGTTLPEGVKDLKIKKEAVSCCPLLGKHTNE